MTSLRHLSASSPLYRWAKTRPALKQVIRTVYWWPRYRRNDGIFIPPDTDAAIPAATWSEFAGNVQGWESENHILQDFYTAVENGDRFLDLGCHTGLYVAAAADAGADEIIGVDTVPRFVWRSGATASYNNASFHGICGRGGVDWDTDLLRTMYGPFDVVKIDVEGDELAVLRTGEAVIGNARAVYCEVHPDEVKGEDVEQGLADLGFNVERFKKESDQHILKGA